MKKLTKLDVQGAESLDGLQYAKNLESLNIEYNEIKNLSPLKDLKKLTNLNANNQIISAGMLNKKDNKIYLPEYEVRFNLDGSIITAKYDLIIIDENSIEVWDWKTENVKLEYIKVKDRIQTVVYMFLAKEAVCKIFNLNIDYNNIKMKYYQPQYDDIPIEIIYNERQHELNKSNIIRYIDMINNTNYEKNDNYKYELIKNDKHCSFCEFNKLCNRQDVVYSMLEEDIYEC